ncbi:MAG: cysteine desulfurase NifS [Deltaproteobacteria bacterium]|nr:MAG: cysteine desulfurase NifS [Deltaproteobacteria bacterium]
MIYLDYNATTPIAQEVAEAMMPYITEDFGNPSSAHFLGARAREALENAREQVCNLLGCDRDEIIFTGGGTESNNMVLKGVAWTLREKGRHIITTRIEHPSIMNTALFLVDNEYDVTFLPVDEFGTVAPDEVKRAVRGDTILITVMHANNETGTIQPIAEISGLAKEHGILFHTDAAQSIGKIDTRVGDLGVDLLTVAGHKLYAPKGVGALYIRKGIEIEPILHGGGQERGLRSGTENMILSVGLGKACELIQGNLSNEIPRIKKLRDRLYEQIASAVPEAVVHGHPEQRLPNTLFISFPGMVGEEILKGIPDLCASTGAACHDQTVSLSHVLGAMGVTKEVGMGAVRLSVGRPSTEDEVDQAARLIIEAVNKVLP